MWDFMFGIKITDLVSVFGILQKLHNTILHYMKDKNFIFLLNTLIKLLLFDSVNIWL